MSQFSKFTHKNLCKDYQRYGFHRADIGCFNLQDQEVIRSGCLVMTKK